jgi:phosphate starvation-inducible PhoH-like protein
VSARGGEVTLAAEGGAARERENRVADLLMQLAALHTQGIALGREDIKTAVGIMAREDGATLAEHFVASRLKPSARKTVVAKSPNQRHYIEAIRENDLVFGIGPAGTGKTYLAVAMAISLLNEKRIQRILLCRPAVEAGEKLGFLPGDIAAKVDPYLRPLYDALYDMLEPDRIERLIERGTIEVAPLAFMRGRTLNDAFIILDEAQNTTPEQMKMFLTRIGLDSKAVVTGDVTQIDLPAQKTSGLVEAQEVVAGIPGIAVVPFDKTDVVRHPLVQRIVAAYDERVLRLKEARAASIEDRT